MRNKVLTILLIAGSIYTPIYGIPSVKSFPEIWQSIVTHSKAQKGAELSVKSATKSLERSQNWPFPIGYLSARSYISNAPSLSFIGLLEQRSVQDTDFVPNTLNYPDTKLLNSAVAGLEIPLYESGRRGAQTKLQKHLLEVEKLTESQLKSEEFVYACHAYGAIATIQNHKKKIKTLQEELSNISNRYQLGKKDNPIGYSGLLGMKLLKNRLELQYDQLNIEEKAYYAFLSGLGAPNTEWQPNTQNIHYFLDTFLPIPSHPSLSFKTKAGKERVAATQAGAELEKTQRLPMINAFAQSELTNGNRSTETNYTAGVYAQWRFLDPAEQGKEEEIRLQAASLEIFNEALINQESKEKESLLLTEKTLKETLIKLNESEALLIEQTQIFLSLFNTGTISVLQIIDLLNHRAEWISEHYKTELTLLKTATHRSLKSSIYPPEIYPVKDVQ